MKDMKEGRIILKGTLKNLSPIGIGSGRDNHSDRDVVTTTYPMESPTKIQSLWPIRKESFMTELPFIPATSFMGKVGSLFKNNAQVETYWGTSHENATCIDCSDLMLVKLPGYIKNDCCNLTEIRDGIRLNSEKGTVAEGAKFDYEVIGPGAEFEITMIFRVENNYETALNIASCITTLIRNGLELGSKSTIGYGKINGNARLFELDFSNPLHFKQWIDADFTKNEIEPVQPTLLADKPEQFEINASFRIKNSLIIRSYSANPESPDSVHLKSGGKNILSGSSIKGALRGRAERIYNTIQPDRKVTETLLASLFGDMEKETINKQKVKPDGYTVPSRVLVDEIPVENITEQVQTRIQVDRFIGGTVDGALLEEVPLFPEKDKEQVKNFHIRVEDPQPEDKGLMLLLLKDLWTSDLTIGGEKTIGRGVLEGVFATVTDGDAEYSFRGIFNDPEKLKSLQKYVDALNNSVNIKFHQDRIARFKKSKK
ncbi:MAG: RAMP superfamily CRISPR-associated protein [Bacteroidota bacterium]